MCSTQILLLQCISPQTPYSRTTKEHLCCTTLQRSRSSVLSPSFHNSATHLGPVVCGLKPPDARCEVQASAIVIVLPSRTVTYRDKATSQNSCLYIPSNPTTDRQQMVTGSKQGILNTTEQPSNSKMKANLNSISCCFWNNLLPHHKFVLVKDGISAGKGLHFCWERIAFLLREDCD